jgi:hypothetical protein
MILDEFRKKSQRNRTSDEGNINFRRWMSTEINKVFWREGTRRSCSSAHPPWTAAGPSPDDDFRHHFKIQEYGEREEDEEKLVDVPPWWITTWKGRLTGRAPLYCKNRRGRR